MGGELPASKEQMASLLLKEMVAEAIQGIVPPLRPMEIDDMIQKDFEAGIVQAAADRTTGTRTSTDPEDPMYDFWRQGYMFGRDRFEEDGDIMGAQLLTEIYAPPAEGKE